MSIDYNISRQVYNALPGLNQTKLKKWIELGHSRKKYKYWLDHQDDKKSDALIFGSALDCLLLEPLFFDSKFTVWYEGTRRGKDWEAFVKTSVGKTILTEDQFNNATMCAGALTGRSEFRKVFTDCRKAVLQAEIIGYPCKGEIDLYSEKSDFLFDLKTTRDASIESFSKDVMNYGYHIQAAFYLDLDEALGHKRDAFAFILVESSEPYCTNALVLEKSHPLIELGRKKYRQALQTLSDAMQENEWRDYTPWMPVETPYWVLKELEQYT